MSRTITVKGVGKVSAKPDYVVLSMTLEVLDKDYNKAMDTAAEHIRLLTGALEEAGFEKNSIKTTDFQVRTDYTHDQTCSSCSRWTEEYRVLRRRHRRGSLPSVLRLQKRSGEAPHG